MKKAAFLLSLAAAACCALAGCAKVPEARAVSIFDDSSYTLPFTPDSANNRGSGTDFVCKLTLAEMRDAVGGEGGTAAEVYGECLLIERQNGARTDYYAVTGIGGNSFDFEMPAFTSGAGDLILYPKHLFDLARSGGGILEIAEGEEYAVNGSAEEFARFYEKTGVFTVTRGENALSVEWNGEFPLSDGEVTDRGGASFTAPKYRGSPFTVAFAEGENGRSVCYSVAEE